MSPGIQKTRKIQKPVNYQQDPSLLALRMLLQQLFVHPEPATIADAVTSFLGRHFLPTDDFPRVEGTYSRTIIHRCDNGYEGMAARWSKGALTSIHGHPPFVFYYVIKGKLTVDNYIRNTDGLIPSSTMVLTSGEGFHAIGEPGRFDNSIHQVQADEETLSLHISSDDGTKGRVFYTRDVLAGQTADSVHADSSIFAGQLAPWRGPMELLPIE